MRRTLSWLVLVVTAVLLPVTPAPATETQSAGTQQIATCLQSARTISAMFLLDRSGSLDGSDPTGIRYDGLRVALDSLARMTRPDGEPLDVEVAIAAFDHRYDSVGSVVDWTQVNGGEPDDRDQLLDDLVAETKESTTPDGGTDFETALEGAADDLADRGARGTCRVLFWFTDGAFETAHDSVEAARARMCTPDSGLLDTMRKDGIVIVGLQLGPTSSDLIAMSTGEAPDMQCGRSPTPSDWATGEYIQANDAAALRRLFGTLGNLVQGCTPQGDRKGMVDPGVRRLNVTLNTPRRARTVRLDAPDGTVIVVGPEGSVTQDGYTAVAQSDASYISVTIDFPPGRGAGRWTVTSDPQVAVADMTYCVFSGLHLERVDPAAQPRAGGEGAIAYQAVDEDGNVADLGDFRDVAVGASAVAAGGELRKTTARVKGNQIIIGVVSEPTDARMQIRLNAQLVTASGLALTPLAADEGVAFTLSKAFPTVSPVELDLGTAIKDKPTSADLILVGSPMGPSQVCIDAPTDITVPTKVARQTISVREGCIDLEAGANEQVTVTMTPVEPTVGNGEAVLPVRLVPVAGSEMDGQTALVELPVLWRYENPRDVLVLWTVVVLAALLSLALPLLALGLANIMTARFSTQGVKGEVIPVMIGPDGPRRINPLDADPTGVLNLWEMGGVPVADSRRFSYGPVEFRARSRFNPFKAPSFHVRPLPDGHRVLSSVHPPSSDGRTALATPGLGFYVVAVVAEADLASPGRQVPANLVVFVRDPRIAQAELDPLMNSRMPWETLTEQWRSDNGRNDDPLNETGASDVDGFEFLDDSPTPARDDLDSFGFFNKDEGR